MGGGVSKAEDVLGASCWASFVSPTYVLQEDTFVVPKPSPVRFAGHQTNWHNGAECPVKYSVRHLCSRK